MMAVAIARDVRDGEVIGIGVNSPIPTAGVLLAGRMHAPRMRFRIDGNPGGIGFLGSKEFFDFAQRGRLDLFFLSGIQIDAHANINLHVLGEHARPRRRFPGAFGSAVLYHVAKRVILFRTEHSRRTFVPRVDFVTASGETPAGQERPGGPHLVVTPLAVLAFNRSSGLLELASFHPGQTPQSVQAATGFELGAGPDLRETPAPTAEELELLRGPVYAELAGSHPAFVAAQRSPV
jgi:glutaconate CoA-transferase, subunit B